MSSRAPGPFVHVPPASLGRMSAFTYTAPPASRPARRLAQILHNSFALPSDPGYCEASKIPVATSRKLRSARATSRILKQRMKTADEGRVVPAEKPRSESSNGFQNPLPRRSLADSGEIFECRGRSIPNNRTSLPMIFSTISNVHALPYIGTPVKGHPHSGGFSILRSTSTPAWTRTGSHEILDFRHSSRKDPQF